MLFNKSLTTNLTTSIRHVLLPTRYLALILIILQSFTVNATCISYEELCDIPGIILNQNSIYFTPEADPSFSPAFNSEKIPNTLEVHATLKTGQTLCFYTNNGIPLPPGINILQLCNVQSPYSWYLHVISSPAIPYQCNPMSTALFQQPTINEQVPATTAIEHTNPPISNPFPSINAIHYNVAELQTRVHELENQQDYNAQIQEELKQKNETIEQLKNTIKQLTASLSENQSQHKTLKENLNHTIAKYIEIQSILKLNEQKKNTDKSDTNLKQEIYKKENELKAIKQKLETALQEKNEIERNMELRQKANDTEKNSLQKQLSSKEKKLCSQISDFEKSQQQSTERHSKNVSKLQKEITNIKQQNKKEINRIKQQHKKEISNLNKEKKDEHDLLEARIDVQKEMIKNITKASEKIEKSLEEKNNAISRQKETLEKEEKQKANLITKNELLTKLNNENKGFYNQHTTLNKRYKLLNNDYNRLHNQHISLTKEYTNSLSLRHELTIKNKELASENNKLNKKYTANKEGSLPLTDQFSELDQLLDRLKLSYRLSSSSDFGLIYTIGRSLGFSSVEASFLKALHMIITNKDTLSEFISDQNAHFNDIEKVLQRSQDRMPKEPLLRSSSYLFLIFSKIYDKAIIVIHATQHFGENTSSEAYKAVKIRHSNPLEYLTENELSDNILDNYDDTIILGFLPGSKKSNTPSEFFHIDKKHTDQHENIKTELTESIE